MHHPDVLIAKIAARQYGVFTHPQAIAAGFTQQMIDGRVGCGRWHRQHRAVYAMAGSPDGLERRCLAAAFAANGWVSHRPAGELWEFDINPSSDIDVLVPHRRASLLRGVTVHRSRTILPSDLTKLGVVPITSPLRTLLDLAEVLSKDDLEDVLDSALQRRVRFAALRTRLDADCRGRPGFANLKRLLAERTPHSIPGSRPENRVRRILVRGGLPEPIRQFRIRDVSGRVVARPDLSYPEVRVYIEYDGGDHATPEQLAADHERQNKLAELDWLPVRFTKESLRDPHTAIVERVRSVLGRRSSRKTG